MFKNMSLPKARAPGVLPSVVDIVVLVSCIMLLMPDPSCLLPESYFVEDYCIVLSLKCYQLSDAFAHR